jgi:8-oxo-dGTP diphosphatase/2-hydroxy-dATP diphosphatase
MKKRGFGAGHYNGFGGKVEPGETIAEGAARELQEEAGIHCPDMRRIGQIEFVFEGDPCLLEVHVYCGSVVQGDITESDEMAPQWFPMDSIPLDTMWPDDTEWFPTMLLLTAAQQGIPAAATNATAHPVAPGCGDAFFARFLFRGTQDIIARQLSRVPELPPCTAVTAIPMPWDAALAAAWMKDMCALIATP